jgi:hypothetical protein
MGNWDLDSIIKHLNNNAKPYPEIVEFSSKPGIYALFFYGEIFPVTPLQDKIKKSDLLYIGKTESSQKARDEDTHFADNKTGSSTLRRSFGALLMDNLELVPIPRNNSDFEAGRLSQFKFEPKSEIKLTSWMKSNLGLSFYEYMYPDIDDLETYLIQKIIPPLNIDWKNPHNPFSSDIKRLRRRRADLANFSNYNSTQDEITGNSFKKGNKKMGANKYEKIWRDNLTSITSALKNAQIKPVEIAMPAKLFEEVGKRKSYAFFLKISKGIVVNDISGSAVARDLRNIFLESIETMALLNNGSFEINMDKNFRLTIKKIF